ncbi:hypothetical protein Xszus_02469 [Xenorhabdus szentirmaii]|uniref:Uncharacterized protein n=1 Tax=Xenorhabdus szentirmaii DSM 16338 TaxID=1427518 RepID=W1J275_9GAMM|nr:hypothetical protein Xsze_00373 [Xenorhabdus szentirmaii DSM 16338]PHM42725.1 hypothetical protein Xszus_02469 [Xenorhabdus szentirmaii]CDL84168.1 hypothetical protein XSR1_400006 [Xenorhabdus szentirmaii DSM 16338]
MNKKKAVKAFGQLKYQIISASHFNSQTVMLKCLIWRILTHDNG